MPGEKVDFAIGEKVSGQGTNELLDALRTELLQKTEPADQQHVIIDSGLWGASDWTQVHTPAANTQATTTKAAGGGSVRHVCTGLTVILAAGATAPTATNLLVNLRDGASGAGTILWSATISIPNIAGAMNGISRSGLFIRGTANTAMTLEFAAAAGANTIESVAMEGVDIT